MLKVGHPWCDSLHASRDEVLRLRDLHAEERAARPSLPKWYAGRSVLVTGGSGFLGRVLVEFLLRCCPDIARIYLVLRAKKGVDAAQRLATLLDVPLFDRLRSEQPSALSKVVPLSGDMEALSLGLSEEDRRRVCADVSIVLHVAASVRFDDSFRKAVLTNVRSAREVVELAKAMPKLKVLTHVSTTYCNINQEVLEEQVYPTEHDWREAIRWAEMSEEDQQAIDFLGPKLRGFQPNTYTMTKALAERLMEDAAADLPVIITRPSIVVGSYSDPIPGWNDNLNGLSGFWAGAFKGLLKVVRGRAVTFDTVPVDIVAKIILIATWAKGLAMPISPSAKEGVDVINVAVGNNIGISYEDMKYNTMDGASRFIAYPGCLRDPEILVAQSDWTYALLTFYHHIVFGVVVDTLARLAGVKNRVMPLYRKIAVAMAATSPFRVPVTFKLENERYLMGMLHPDDATDFECVQGYSFRDNPEAYLDTVVHNLRGIMVYVLKEEDNFERNSRHLSRVRWIMRGYHTVMILIGCSLFWSIYFFWRHLHTQRAERQL